MIRETLYENNTTIHTRLLDDTVEAIDLARQVSSGSVRTHLGNASITGSTDFTGTSSLDHAITLFEGGWDEGRERVEEALAEVNLDDVTAQLRQTIEVNYDVSGDEPDVDRYLSGEPENMMEFLPEQTRFGRVVDLKVNVSQHAFVSESAILRRGLVVVAAAGMVAAAGYGLRIEAVEQLTPSSWDRTESSRLEYAIPIAHAGDYFNIDTVIFALAHPSFLRRILFAVEEHEHTAIRKEFGIQEDGGYGHPEHIRRTADDTSVYIEKDDYLSRDIATVPSDAQELAKRLIHSVSEQTE
ncbi:hypothetical protein KC957_03600 [Candidatus Saccharibacteria bacterium]|nr:hypothetical protein [Candidatus Saccharibacteria bacterium]